MSDWQTSRNLFKMVTTWIPRLEFARTWTIDKTSGTWPNLIEMWLQSVKRVSNSTCSSCETAGNPQEVIEISRGSRSAEEGETHEKVWGTEVYPTNTESESVREVEISRRLYGDGKTLGGVRNKLLWILNTLLQVELGLRYRLTKCYPVTKLDDHTYTHRM